MHGISRQRFGVRVDPDRARFWLDLESFSQPLDVRIAIDTVAAADVGPAAVWDGASQSADRDSFRWHERGARWTKRYGLEVHADHVSFGADVHVDGEVEVDAIRFFDSPVAFRRVFCPEPNSYLRQEFEPAGYGQISVHWDLDHCGGNFAANPATLCYAVAGEPDREWLAFGLGVEPGAYLFSEYEYIGGKHFRLGINSWGARRIRGGFRTPRMVIVPADSPVAAISRYIAVLRKNGLVHVPRRDQPNWWSRPIVCGWGHQSYQADLFRRRSPAERVPDNAAYVLSTQATYRDIVEHLDEQDLPWGTLVIDARWFVASGLKDVDVGRWPDLRAFIDALHRRGRRVLLWWGPWDTEGVPAGLCIRSAPAARGGQRPDRRLRFAAQLPGQKLAVDVTLPTVRALIRDQVRLMLGREGFDADGLKIDHMSAAPGGYDMTFPDGSGRLFGIEAARSCIELLYTSVKEVKPDGLLIGQSPNPYFADVQDMVRLGIAANSLDSVVPEVTFGSAMARVADPAWLVETNGWPIPSRAALRELVLAQPELGVPSLYYATHLDTTGEPFTVEDYAAIRQAWTGL